MAADRRPSESSDGAGAGERGACPVLPTGIAVHSRDGRRLGRVKEAHERCFLLDVPLAFDYWLSMRAVAAVAGGRVRLGVDKARVADYLVDPDCLDDFEHLEPVTPGGIVPGLSPTAP